MKKIVLLSYEFTYSPFSGNGILARSLVKSFLGLGCTVTVWCCRPSRDTNDTNLKSSNNHLKLPEISQDSMNRFEVIPNFVPSDAWNRVDDQSGWMDFTKSNLLLSDAGKEKARRLLSAIADADVICVIDWSGGVAYRSILSEISGTADIASKVHLYLNFRVYSLGVDDPKRREWYDEMEYKAMKYADIVVPLSSQDREQLSVILQKNEEKAQTSQNPRIPIEIVLPPLRQDMESFSKSGNSSEDFQLHLPNSIRSRIASGGNSSGNTISNQLFLKRPIVACVARQSPEKCIQRFVKFTEMASDVLEELKLTIVLAGAASDIEYARKIRERLLKAVPSAIVVDRFLSPKELGAVFAHTILNFHPSSYDAYGMTIVEAAVFGAPTVVAGPRVGAFRLLGEDGCLRVAMDDTDENILSETSLTKIVHFLRESQKNESSWERLSSKAREKALAWDEKSYGQRMLQIINGSTYTE